ncbi:AGAP011666-PA, partial [Anopheles gambiae str. PEST]
VALVRQVITEDCGQEELVQCTRPLQVLSATSELSFVTKKEELDKLCPDLHKGLHCIRSYTRRCMNIHQRDHFNKLYHGTNEVIHELCEEGPYQEGTYVLHAPCMRHVKKDYEVCAIHYQSTMAKIGHHPNSTKSVEDAEEERLKTVCCAFQKYMQCSEFTVRHACGDETALFTRKFLDKMSNTLMRMHCVDYTPESGKCRDYFSSSATPTGLTRWSSSNMVTLAIVTVLAVVHHWLGTFI